MFPSWKSFYPLERVFALGAMCYSYSKLFTSNLKWGNDFGTKFLFLIKRNTISTCDSVLIYNLTFYTAVYFFIWWRVSFFKPCVLISCWILLSIFSFSLYNDFYFDVRICKRKFLMVKIEIIFLICINVEVWVSSFLTYIHVTLSLIIAILNLKNRKIPTWYSAKSL